MSLPVAILAGGRALRLKPLSDSTPKALIDVAGKPFIAHQVELLRRNGLNEIVLCLGYLGDQVKTALGDGREYGVHLEYSFDGSRPLGTGGALCKALPLLGESFFVLYGDSYLDCDYAGIESAYRESGKPALMTVYRNSGRWDRSNVLFSDGLIRRYDKVHPSRQMVHIDYGLGVMSSDAMRPYSSKEELDLAVIYQDLLSEGRLAGFEVNTRFYEIGSPAGLQELRRHLARVSRLQPSRSGR